MKLQGFIGAAYRARSKAIDSQLCINLYPEIEQADSKNVKALLGTPGLREYYTFSGAGRGLFYSAAADEMYGVVGSGFYKFTIDPSEITVWTYIGALNTTQGTVRFAENAMNQVILVDGTDGYIYNTSTGAFAAIVRSGDAVGFPTSPTHVGFLAGYFIANKGGTGDFYWSHLDSASSDPGGLFWDALDFANAEGSPDALKGLIVSRGELWLIGSATAEVWYLTSESDSSNRFQQIKGTVRDKGTSAPNSIVSIHDHIFYLGSTEEGYGIVWMSNGYEMVRISDPAIEYDIRSYSTISDAIGFTYQFEGHVFYVISFPAGNKTWVFDLSTNMWHQWSFHNETTGKADRARAVYQAFFNKKDYVLDWENGRVLTIDADVFTDWSPTNSVVNIRRVRSSPHIHNDRKRIYYGEFELDFERGVGVVNDPTEAIDPEVILQISNDGGYTFGNKLSASMGKIGDRLVRANWHRLGQSRDRVFKIVITDAVRVVLVAAHIQVKA